MSAYLVPILYLCWEQLYLLGISDRLNGTCKSNW